MNKLRELRKNRGLTQLQFCQKFNITQSTVSGWECGKWQPDNETLLKLADFFGVSVDYILGRGNFETKKIAPAPNTGNESYSAEERELIKKYRSLSSELKEMLNDIIGTWTQENEINFTRNNKNNV